MYEKYMNGILNSKLFKGISKEDIETMLRCIKPKIETYTKNEFVAIAEEDFDSVGILLTGEAIISKENFSGKRVVMSILKPGDSFGEMVVFANHSKWPATVQAQDFCEVLYLKREKIIGECEKMCGWHKSLIENMLRVVSERALMLNKKVEYLSMKSIRGKVCTFLLEQHKRAKSEMFQLPMNRNEMADFLNVSRPSMSREMGKLKEEGIIDFQKEAIKIIDLEAMKRMTEG